MDCELIVRVKLEVDGREVTVELDRENAEKLRAKLDEALPKSPTYIPQPYPVYVPPVYVPLRPWWEGPIRIWCSGGTSSLKALSSSATYSATVK